MLKGRIDEVVAPTSIVEVVRTRLNRVKEVAPAETADEARYAEAGATFDEGV
jgi:hypothetical protein